jgi:hypothetical protein
MVERSPGFLVKGAPKIFRLELCASAPSHRVRLRSNRLYVNTGLPFKRERAASQIASASALSLFQADSFELPTRERGAMLNEQQDVVLPFL